jgi:hypothetical protein
LLAGIHDAGSPIVSRSFSGVSYLFGRDVAEAVFYRNLLIMFFSVGIVYALRERRRWLLMGLGMLVTGYGTGGLRVVLDGSVDGMVILYTLAGGVLVLAAAVPSPSSDKNTDALSPRVRQGQARYWYVIGQVSGYLLGVIALGIALFALAPISYPFGTGWEPSGLAYVLYQEHYPAAFDLSITTAAIGIIVLSLVRTEVLRWLQVFAVLVSPTLVPAFVYGSPRTLAIAAGSTLLIVAATAHTLSVQTRL